MHRQGGYQEHQGRIQNLLYPGEEAVCDIDALPEELKGVVHAFCKEHVYYVS